MKRNNNTSTVTYYKADSDFYIWIKPKSYRESVKLRNIVTILTNSNDYEKN